MKAEKWQRDFEREYLKSKSIVGSVLTAGGMFLIVTSLAIYFFI